jgi:hypothetical protein
VLAHRRRDHRVAFGQSPLFAREPASTSPISPVAPLGAYETDLPAARATVTLDVFEPISTPSSTAPTLAVPATEHRGFEISTPSAAAPGLATPRAGDLPCADLSPDCAAWQALGECSQNSVYMLIHCAVACGSCGDQASELRAARAAAADVVGASGSARGASAAALACRDTKAECAHWATTGECDRNPTYMRISCAASCDSCEWADPSRRCRKDPDSVQAVPRGAIGELFRAIEAGEVGSEYGARIVSRPPQPWVTVFDRFIELAHADAIVAIANGEDGARFQPSMGTDGVDEHGQLVPTLSAYRTSSTYWCEADCLNMTAVASLRDKVAALTRVPDSNHEYPQLLRYFESQEYKVHSNQEYKVQSRPVGLHRVCVPRRHAEEGPDGVLAVSARRAADGDRRAHKAHRASGRARHQDVGQPVGAPARLQSQPPHRLHGMTR